jgi:hypothetical protein
MQGDPPERDKNRNGMKLLRELTGCRTSANLPVRLPL